MASLTRRHCEPSIRLQIVLLTTANIGPTAWFFISDDSSWHRKCYGNFNQDRARGAAKSNTPATAKLPHHGQESVWTSSEHARFIQDATIELKDVIATGFPRGRGADKRSKAATAKLAHPGRLSYMLESIATFNNRSTRTIIDC